MMVCRNDHGETKNCEEKLKQQVNAITTPIHLRSWLRPTILMTMWIPGAQEIKT